MEDERIRVVVNASITRNVDRVYPQMIIDVIHKNMFRDWVIFCVPHFIFVKTYVTGILFPKKRGVF